jgi:hypothetical protein
MNLNGVGGIRWEDTNNPENRLQDQKSIMFFGEDGSNIFMGKGYNQYFSKFDRRDQVEGDRWETTLGNNEEWVQADKNIVVMGDLYVKIGNVSQPAVDAVARIQEIIGEIQAPLSESSGGSEGGSSSSVAADPTTKESAKLPDNLQRAIDDQHKERMEKLGVTDPGEFQMKTENKVPAYLQANASQSTKDQFFADSRAIQASRNTTTFQNTPSFTNAGTATTGLKNVPSTISVPSGALRTSTVGFSTSPTINVGSDIKKDSASGRSFSVSTQSAQNDRRTARNQILGR